MKILALAGSNSGTSINKKLLRYTLTLLTGNSSTEVLDLNDFQLPIYSPSLESSKGIPEDAVSFAQKIDEAMLIFISMAEHNGNFSAAFKNLLDWTSRIPNRKVFNDKPVFLMATAPGPRGGAGVLEIAEKRFPFDGANVLGIFSLPTFQSNFNDHQGITDQNKQEELVSKLEEIKKQYF